MLLAKKFHIDGRGCDTKSTTACAGQFVQGHNQSSSSFWQETDRRCLQEAKVATNVHNS